MRLVTLGDLILDVIVATDEPLVADDDRPATTRLCAGGQAANVAAWAAHLGATARYLGKRGADAAGRLVASELAAHGVEVCGPAEGRNGVVVSLAAGGARSMASDRGSAIELRPDELDPAWFACDRLHLSGYALMQEPVAHAALHATELARVQGATISIDLSAWSLIDDTFRARVRAIAPETVFANERERVTFGALGTGWVVERGAAGVTVAGMHHPSHPTDVLDATGAGDAFAAGFLVGGVDRGLQAAAACCARLGAMP